MCWYEPIKNYSVVGRFVGGKIVDPPTPLYRPCYDYKTSQGHLFFKSSLKINAANPAFAG